MSIILRAARMCATQATLRPIRLLRTAALSRSDDDDLTGFRRPPARKQSAKSIMTSNSQTKSTTKSPAQKPASSFTPGASATLKQPEIPVGKLNVGAEDLALQQQKASSAADAAAATTTATTPAGGEERLVLMPNTPYVNPETGEVGGYRGPEPTRLVRVKYGSSSSSINSSINQLFYIAFMSLLAFSFNVPSHLIHCAIESRSSSEFFVLNNLPDASI